MKYMLAILLNIFYAVCYEINIPAWIVFLLTIVMLILIYHYSVKINSKIGALLELLCFTLPFAWRSIFGNGFESFQICWFYIIGLVLFIRLIFSKRSSVHLSKESLLSIFCIIFLMCWGIIPLINSYSFKEGFTEYILYGFFYIIVFASILHEGELTQENKNKVLKSFTYMALYSSMAIVIQYILAQFGINILKHEMFGSSSVRYAYAYMFEDMSSASIFLVSGAMICLLYGKRIFNHPYVVLIIIIIGTALSSTRTGIVSFFIIASIFTLFSRNGKHKIAKISIFLTLIYLIVNLYNLIRPMESVTNIVTYDNGRIDLLIYAYNVFIRNPILGIGFDKSAFILLTGSETIVHTYIITVLVMTGIIYTMVFILLIFLAFLHAKKTKNIEEIWALLLCFFGSLFIPNLMGTRFLVILFSVVFLSADKKVYIY